MTLNLSPNFFAGTAAALLAINCVFLIVSRHYDDGVMGRISLSVIAICCAIVSYDAYMCHGNFHFHVTTAILMWAVLIFVLRHTRRYIQALRHQVAADRTGLRRHNDHPEGMRHARG